LGEGNHGTAAHNRQNPIAVRDAAKDARFNICRKLKSSIQIAARGPVGQPGK